MEYNLQKWVSPKNHWLVLVLAHLLVGSCINRLKTDQQQLNTDLVKICWYTNGKLNVKELLENEPTTATPRRTTGAVENFESGIEAAGHMGNKEFTGFYWAKGRDNVLPSLYVGSSWKLKTYSPLMKVYWTLEYWIHPVASR